jgi:hypothetical protein
MHCVRTTTVYTRDGCLGLKVAMDVHFAARCAQGSIGGSFCDARSVMYKFVRTVDVTAYAEYHELGATGVFWMYCMANALCSMTDLFLKLVSGK